MGVDLWIEFILNWAAVPVGLFAFVHAGLQRGDAYTAANKRTKPFWMALTGGGTVACALFHFYDFTLMFWIAGLVTILVYIVDVKPKVVEVQRGSQW
ncbi:MAG TPA: DUF2516 family protein [Pseudonocardiaceae bacterium]|nr:DUF2516 family protein [Pseudonocardiaceae bacterium]